MGASGERVVESSLDDVDPGPHDETHQEIDPIEILADQTTEQFHAEVPVELRDQCRSWPCPRSRWLQVVASLGDDVPHTAAWVGHISVEPRDDMQMEMPNGLARRRTGVESHVVPIGCVLRVEPSLDVVNEFKHCEPLGRRGFPPLGDEPARDHQGVTGADRETNPESRRRVRCSRPSRWDPGRGRPTCLVESSDCLVSSYWPTVRTASLTCLAAYSGSSCSQILITVQPASVENHVRFIVPFAVSLQLL